MENLEPSLSNTLNLDESFSNFGIKDLFTKKAISAALLTGSPIGAFYEAKNQDAKDLQQELMIRDLSNEQLHHQLASVQETANVTVGDAQDKIEKYNKATADLRMQEAKVVQTKNIIQWSVVGSIVIALGVTAYFVFRK